MDDRLIWDRDGRDWPNREASTFVDAAGMSWHVQIAGQGPVVLLLHGTGASTHSWAPLFSRLAQRFTVVAPDLPGHAFTGVNSERELSLPGMAASIAGLLDTLKVKPELAVGHSAGAAILVRMALDGQIAPAGIVSINGAIRPLGGAAGQFFSPLAKLLVINPFVPKLFTWRARSPGAVERLLTGTGSVPPAWSVERYTRLFRSSVHVARTLAMMAQWDLHALERDLPRLKTRLLLIASANDKAIPPADARWVRDAVANARVVDIAGAGHLVHEEQPQHVAEIIEQFAAEVGARAAP